MGIFKHLVIGAAQMGKYAAAGVAQQQAMAEHHKTTRRKSTKSEGCTPCAAKKKGAEMANRIWK